MKKNIKRIVAMAIAIGTISGAAPTTNINFLTTKAYASNDDADTIDSLELQDHDGATLSLYDDDDYEDEVDDDLDEGEIYYAESSTNKVKIDNIDGADDDKVRIFEGSSDKAYEVGDNISLSDETTTLKVRVYEDNYDEGEDYSSSDYNEFKIKVEYTDYDEDDNDDENDEDTLDSLELLNADDNTIKLYSDKDYDSDNKVDSDEVDEGETYYAKTSSEKVSVAIEGPDEDYVKIFKSTSDSAEGIDPGDDISISGDKTLTVRIYSEEPDSDVTYEEDDDVIGEYTIKLEYLGDDDSTSTSTETSTQDTATSTPSNATSVATTAVKTMQWVLTNGKWQYYDVAGNQIKNNWFYDINLAKNYYLQADGNMATGWLSNNGRWYYLGTDGAMKTGWQFVNGKWYYLDSQGVMACNTIIGGYKLDSTGAWIK